MLRRLRSTGECKEGAREGGGEGGREGGRERREGEVVHVHVHTMYTNVNVCSIQCTYSVLYMYIVHVKCE